MQLSLLSGAAALSLIAAAPASAALPKDFAAKADKLVAQSWAADEPGAAVIVTDHGKIVYQSERGSGRYRGQDADPAGHGVSAGVDHRAILGLGAAAAGERGQAVAR